MPETESTGAGDTPQTKAQIDYDQFAQLDLRVGTITAAEAHPNADRLLKLQVDLGELGARQICAGIRGHYEPQALVGRQIVVIVNLAPRKIRGEVSNGMLLAASQMEGDTLADIVLLAPDKAVAPGSSIS